jgi:uncharacterized damage-inducible protein DinB
MAPADLLQPLEGQRELTMKVVMDLTDADLDRVDRESGWTVRQTLGHMASSQHGEIFLIRLALEGDVVHLSEDDRDRFNEAEVDRFGDWPLEKIGSELEEAQAALREIFASMSEEDLDLPIRWPSWPARTIRTSIPYMLEHEDSHLDGVRRALER